MDPKIRLSDTLAGRSGSTLPLNPPLYILVHPNRALEIHASPKVVPLFKLSRCRPWSLVNGLCWELASYTFRLGLWRITHWLALINHALKKSGRILDRFKSIPSPIPLTLPELFLLVPIPLSLYYLLSSSLSHVRTSDILQCPSLPNKS